MQFSPPAGNGFVACRLHRPGSFGNDKIAYAEEYEMFVKRIGVALRENPWLAVE